MPGILSNLPHLVFRDPTIKPSLPFPASGLTAKSETGKMAPWEDEARDAEQPTLRGNHKTLLQLTQLLPPLRPWQKTWKPGALLLLPRREQDLPLWSQLSGRGRLPPMAVQSATVPSYDTAGQRVAMTGPRSFGCLLPLQPQDCNLCTWQTFALTPGCQGPHDHMIATCNFSCRVPQEANGEASKEGYTSPE